MRPTAHVPSGEDCDGLFVLPTPPPQKQDSSQPPRRTALFVCLRTLAPVHRGGGRSEKNLARCYERGGWVQPPPTPRWCRVVKRSPDWGWGFSRHVFRAAFREARGEQQRACHCTSAGCPFRFLCRHEGAGTATEGLGEEHLPCARATACGAGGVRIPQADAMGQVSASTVAALRV